VIEFSCDDFVSIRLSKFLSKDTRGASGVYSFKTRLEEAGLYESIAADILQLGQIVGSSLEILIYINLLFVFWSIA